MRKLLENPLLGRARGGWPETPAQALLAALLVGLVLLGPWQAGVCACTMFEVGALLLVLLTALRGGSTLYGAITGEREKRTLDGLRLTQLTPGQVVLGKISGELVTLSWSLLSALPALAILAFAGGLPVQALVGTLAVAAAAGLFASASGLLASSLAATTSQAVLWGWVFKGAWLAFSPFCDLMLRAVLVRSETPVFFTAVNPVAALLLTTIPEAAFGSCRWLAPMNLAFLLLGSLALLGLVCTRLAGDPPRASDVQQGAMHPAWRRGWAPSWVQALLPGLSRNAAFLREVAWQGRTGAFAWPGLAIWLVLFLAPFLYARAWSLQSSEPSRPAGAPRIVVSVRAPVGSPLPPSHPAEQAGARAVYATVPGQQTALVIRGHRPETCLRLALYRDFGVPMPWGAVLAVEPVGPPTGAVRQLRIRPLDQVDPRTLGDLAMAPPPPPPPPPDFGHRTLDSMEKGPQAALLRPLQVGLLGTVLLFLLNLTVRSTALLAGALTGERERQTWQDLALTGIPARQVVFGKLWGALLMPLFQMSLVFPVLLIYVFAGVLSLLDLGALYLFSVGLALTAGLLGLWSSARAGSTHASQAWAVTWLLLAFALGLVTGAPEHRLIPVTMTLIGALVAFFTHRSTWKGWLGMSLGLLAAPQALSPLAAVAGFVPALGRLTGLAGPVEELYPLVGFLGAMLFLAGTSLFLVRAILERIEDPARGGGLRVQSD